MTYAETSTPHTRLRALVLFAVLLVAPGVQADSVNSPNVALNVDANRVGPGGGNTFVAVGTITIAETQVTEYSTGAGQAFSLRVAPGFQLDPGSPVTALSATIGMNGASANVASILTPSGVPDEVLTWVLTSGGTAGQDIIRVNGIRLRIASAAGAAGPARATLSMTTSGIGGAFTDQAIVAATIATGAADHLVLQAPPADGPAGEALLPSVAIVDFGGNPVSADPRSIALALEENPAGGDLRGVAQRTTVNGLATWATGDGLRIETAAGGYTLRATHDGAPFAASDAVVSDPFTVTPSTSAALRFLQQPSETPAGAVVTPPVRVEIVDAFGNRTAVADRVDLSLLAAPCDGSASGASVAASDGIATFDALSVGTPCAGDVLNACAGNLCAASDPFTVTARHPISADLVALRPGRIAKLVATGALALPDRTFDDPTVDGGALTITSRAGSTTYALPPAGWRALGGNTPGFRFRGVICSSVVLKVNGLKVACRLEVGGLDLPEPGPVDLVLTVGSGKRRYCVECGGAAAGAAATVFKRTGCTVPAACR